MQFVCFIASSHTMRFFCKHLTQLFKNLVKNNKLCLINVSKHHKFLKNIKQVAVLLKIPSPFRILKINFNIFDKPF